MKRLIILTLLSLYTSKSDENNPKIKLNTYYTQDKTFVQNPFHQFHKRTALLTAGGISNYNSLTIGWGTIGVLWQRPVMYVYVKPERYSFKFMEENEYFTVSFYGKKHRKQMGLFGSKSGRDMNKAKEANFHPYEVKGTVTYEEAEETYVLKKIYSHKIQLDKIPEEIQKEYESKIFYPTNIPHTEYIGLIVDYIKKGK
jgi:hypothetical protein